MSTLMALCLITRTGFGLLRIMPRFRRNTRIEWSIKPTGGELHPSKKPRKKRNRNFRTNQKIVILFATKCQGKCRSIFPHSISRS